MTLERLGRGALVTTALAGLFLACGPSVGPGPGPGPTPEPPGGGGPSTAEMERSDKAYEKCEKIENTENSHPGPCYGGWLNDYGANARSQDQVRHAQRMSQGDHPVNPGPPDPNPDPHPPRPITIDDTPKPAPTPDGNNGFPKQTVGYGECWKGARLTGDHVADYNNLVNACGKPTGMLPFSKPMQGELNDSNKGDAYTVKLVGGGCYRFFAVAGGSIKDIDIAIATMENKIVAADKYTQPVAIIEWQKPVCVEHDVQFKFIVARDGSGSGGYGFGIWVKPAGAG